MIWRRIGVLRRVGPLSLAKITAVVYGIIGLILGAVFSLIAGLGAAFGIGASDNPLGLFFGVGAVIWLPLFYGGLGFVFALIGALLYNSLAGWVGGVKVEFQEETPPVDTRTITYADS